jgi:hypothetical protein
MLGFIPLAIEKLREGNGGNLNGSCDIIRRINGLEQPNQGKRYMGLQKHCHSSISALMLFEVFEQTMGSKHEVKYIC